MPSDPVMNVLSRVEGARKIGDGQWLCFCPVHEKPSNGHQPSLSVSQGDEGRVLVHCHGGCTHEQICAALGLNARDLFDDATRPAAPAKRKARRVFKTPEDAYSTIAKEVSGTFVMEWKYPGDVLRVARFLLCGGGKTYRPIHRHENRWVTGDPVGTLPLYRGDEIPTSGPIVVLEGEKCVDATATIGLAGVTSAHGAEAAAKTDWSPLAGRDVIILPDNDDAGAGYAEEVASILSELMPPAKVRIVTLPDLPEGGDICDWLDALDAHEPEALRKAILDMAEAAPVWTPHIEKGLVSVGGEAPSHAPKDDAVSIHVLTPKELFAYDTSNDPNTLLGSRYLCRGGSCLVVGQTGLGKSSFCVQAAVTWGLGESLFGIVPVRPLRSLIIQAENDTGDLAEMFTGVIRGTGCEDRLEQIDSQLSFVTEAGRAGECFHAFAFGLIERFRPDLVWIDPLFAFLGGNVSDQETVSSFLRNGLGAIAQATGITWMVVHHTNKPPKEPGMHDGLKSGDFSYLGAGSAELANWARAVLVLRETEGSVFELRASKRGRRAGLVDSQGQPATEIFIKHGTTGICWERAAGPEEQRQDAEAARAEEVVEAMEVGRAYNRHELRDVVAEELGVGKSAVLTPGRRANRIFRFVMAMTHDPEKPGRYAFTGVHKRSQERV